MRCDFAQQKLQLGLRSGAKSVNEVRGIISGELLKGFRQRVNLYLGEYDGALCRSRPNM
jgi:hypothetical protein